MKIKIILCLFLLCNCNKGIIHPNELGSWNNYNSVTKIYQEILFHDHKFYIIREDIPGISQIFTYKIYQNKLYISNLNEEIIIDESYINIKNDQLLLKNQDVNSKFRKIKVNNTILDYIMGEINKDKFDESFLLRKEIFLKK